MFSTDTKRLLKNYILHTDTHNRIVEENDMWKQYNKLKKDDQSKYSTQNSFLEYNGDDMNDSRYNMKSRSAHMDDGREKSTYWMRQLQKTEEADPERWGHSGFKELYPKDFNSDQSSVDSSSSSSSDEKRKKRKKKKRKRDRDKAEWVEAKELEKKKKKSKEKKKQSVDREAKKKHKIRNSDKLDSYDSSNSEKYMKKIDFPTSSDSEKYIPPKRLKKHKDKDNKNKNVHKKRRKHKKDR